MTAGANAFKRMQWLQPLLNVATTVAERYGHRLLASSLLSTTDSVEVLGGNLRNDASFETTVLRRADVALQGLYALLDKQASLRLTP